MSISSKITLAMSADGASFEEVHNNLEKILENFAVQYAEWCCARAIGVTHFKLNEEELEQFKKEKGL